MRKAFIEKLSELARKDPKIILMVADVGFSYIEDFEKEFPNQFVNCGVTEQSMMGMAAGLALSGFKPYVYSMIPFVTMRCYEQLRNDVCYHGANVKVIGVRGSVHYKFLGFSHNVTDDEEKNVLKSLTQLDAYWPEDDNQATAVLEKTYTNHGPAYVRL